MLPFSLLVIASCTWGPGLQAWPDDTGGVSPVKIAWGVEAPAASKTRRQIPSGVCPGVASAWRRTSGPSSRT